MGSLLRAASPRLLPVIAPLSIHRKKEWFVIQTWSRAEKAVKRDLNKLNYETFLPSIVTFNIWKNRQKKLIEKPLFPGYLFVNTGRNELLNLKRVPKIAGIVNCAGIPSVVPMKDIEGVKKLLESGQNVLSEPIFSEGERVRIIEGPLAGQEGILIKQNGKTRFGIQIKEINHTAHIEISTTALEKI
jgi:transcription antitermination factor NusG